MPSAARRPCNHPGCGELLAYGQSYCARHKRERNRQDEERRGTANERGYTGAWQKARAGYLRSHPLCVKHQARDELVPATVVDHIVPHRGDWTLFWSRANWQSLCKPCHDAKTATEDGGFGR